MAAVEGATALVADFCEGEGVGESAEHILVLVLEELITNTVSHGRPSPESPIVVGLNRDGSHVLLDYLDHGCAFDPLRDRRAPDLRPTTERAREGGVGWPLIIHFSDEVDYRREADANVLRFRIPIGAGEAGA